MGKIVRPKPKKVSFSKFLFRASGFGNLMVGLNTISDKQLEEIDRLLEKKKDYIAKGKDLAKGDQTKLDKLIALRDAPLELGKGAKSYLKKTYREVQWNRYKPLENKFLEKGIFNEDEAIAMIGRHKGEWLENNKDRVNGKFFTGECDMIEGYDAKCSWSLDSFPDPDEPLSKIYEFQNRVYMILYDKEQWSTIYVLMDTPRHMVQAELTRESFKPRWRDGIVPDWRKMEIINLLVYTEKTLQKYVKYFEIDFDEDQKAREIMEGFVEIPENRRIIEKVVYRDKKIEDLMVKVAKLSRKELLRLNKL